MKSQAYKLLISSSLVLMVSACSNHAKTIVNIPQASLKPVAYDHSQRPAAIKKTVIKYPHTYQQKAADKVAPKSYKSVKQKGNEDRANISHTMKPVIVKEHENKLKVLPRIRLASYTPNLKAKKSLFPRVNPLYRIRSTWAQIHRGFRFRNYRYQPKVKSYIQSYSAKPGYMALLTERSSGYLPTILQEVKRRGLPTEIALLPFVESGFNTRAYSQAHAAGLWQFIPGTARRYGLKVSKRYDARYNWRLSTNAALNYLVDLNRRFKGDWLLSLAAYNCGERRVERAIARNRARGLPTDFWHLKLPKETRNYVPRLLAYKEIFSYPKVYGVNVVSIPYNPQYRKRAKKKVAKLSSKKLAVRKAVTHRVRSGETLYRIAKRYGVSINKIMRLNQLKSSRIKPGRHLKIVMRRSSKVVY